MNYDAKEALRYFGTKVDDQKALVLLDQAYLYLRNDIKRRNMWVVTDIKVNEDKIYFPKYDFCVASKALAKHLNDCKQAVILAVTLGSNTDIALRRLTMKDIALGMAGQAICAALIESYCNEIEVEIKKEFSESYLKSRFSPGYGDWDLSAQAEILDMLATAKQIGLSYTSGMMLSPLKSVTAVIGISEKNDCKQEDKCKICKMKNCQFRKE